MTGLLFAEPRLKIQRAESFISELEGIIENYRLSKPLSAAIDVTINPPQIQLAWTELPAIHSAILGDVVHNARSALDLMASELVRLRKLDDKNVYFPFSDGEATFDEMVKKRKFDKAGDDAVELVKSFKPYRGGDLLLRGIHDLDIQDKHIRLVPTANKWNTTLTFSYHLDDPTNHSIAADAEITLVFPEGSAFSGEPAIAVLRNAVHLVNGILDAFEKLVRERTAAS